MSNAHIKCPEKHIDTYVVNEEQVLFCNVCEDAYPLSIMTMRIALRAESVRKEGKNKNGN